MGPHKRLLVGAAITALSLSMTACGSQSSDSDGETPAAGASAATGEPIKIGAMAPSDGPAAYPEVEYGIEAAEWYINNELGGINGRPLEVDICRGDGSPETAVACANEFVGASYPVVLDGYDASFGGARPVLTEAGIPFAGTVAGDPTNETVEAPGAFYWTGPLAVTAAGVANLWDVVGSKKANYVVIDAPSNHKYVDGVLMPLAQAQGVELAVQYVDPAKANWNAIAAALMEGDPDMTGSVTLTEDGCTSLFGALRQQGWTGDIFVGSCTKYVEELDPADSAGTYMIPRTWISPSRDHAPDDVVEQLDAFENAMKEVGHEDALEARATYSFSGLVTLAEALQSVEGEYTSESVSAALTSVKDKEMFLGPRITCDAAQWPGRPTACSNQSIFFTVQDDGSYKPGDDTGFVDIPQPVIDTLS